MPANAIGPFLMIRIDGSLEIAQQNFDIESRPGVTGWAIYQTAKRAQPIRVMSIVDVVNQGFAELLYEEYTTWVSLTVAVWQNWVTPNNTEFLILHVEKLRIQNHILGVGGLYGGQTLLTCAWDLLPLEKVT